MEAPRLGQGLIQHFGRGGDNVSTLNLFMYSHFARLNSECYFLMGECCQSLKPCSVLMELSYYGSEIRRHADSRGGAGGTAVTLLHAMNGTIDSMTKTAVFFSLQPGFLR